MSVMGAPGDTNFGINITPIIGANGQLEGIHIGTPAVGAMSFKDMRASASQAARDMRASASQAARDMRARANGAADRAEVAACKRASDAGFEQVAEQRGYSKHA